MKLLTELPLAGERVLIRQDLNVPVEGGRVTSDARIRASLPTLRHAMDAGARIMVMSHLGRPTEGEPDPDASMAPVAERLSELLETNVRLIDDYLDTAPEVAEGEVVLLQNVRFNKGEKANDATLAGRYAALCDVFAMDAFGTAHRAQASTHGVARQAPIACAGPLLANELDALGKALENPERPMVAIVGGAKVSTKLEVLDRLLDKVDQLIVGGGIANTFVAAAGHDVGRSLYEPDLLDTARDLMKKAEARNATIPIPEDLVCATEISADAEAREAAVDDVREDELALDIGPKTAAQFAELLKNARTIVWNGPVGVFEHEAFAEGTRVLGEAIAASPAFSLAGGGDTLAAIDQFGLTDDISYISTGGGAFLEFLEGKTLPAVAVLEERGS